jgi:two-component sensor histidine kinase
MSSRLAEFAVIGDALAAAASALEERSREHEKTVEREALLGRIFDAAGLYVGIIEILDGDYRYLAANRGTAALFGRTEGGIDGMRGSELGLTAADIRVRLDLFRRCENGPVTLEYGFVRGGVEIAWNLGTFAPLPPGPSGNRRLAYTSLDISDRKRGEEQRRLLVNELNHRVKNTLATVQSIAAQTLRGAASMAEARDAFTDRLVALAKAHDVLTHESWKGAELHEIVAEATAPHGGHDRFITSGPPVWLTPALSLSLALALHELATNAAKYGALSVEGGCVRVSWRIAEAEAERRLTLRWAEEGGPKVSPPTKQGFGSRLIGSFSSAMGGSSKADYAPDGLICVIELPIGDEVAPVTVG